MFMLILFLIYLYIVCLYGKFLGDIKIREINWGLCNLCLKEINDWIKVWLLNFFISCIL